MIRHIDHLQAPPLGRADPNEELLASLTKIVQGFPPRSKYPQYELHGLYSGPCGIALLFLHLSCSRPDLEIDNRKSLEWCKAYLGAEANNVNVTPAHCGIANERLAHLALNASVENSLDSVSDLVTILSSLKSNDSPSNEWLYGRAGALYLLRLVNHYNPNLPSPLKENFVSTIDDLVIAIIDSGPEWIWHGKRYLGAAHGDVGILTQMLLSSRTARTQRAEVWDWLVELLNSSQMPSGNFPSSLGEETRRDKLVQFCHRAPGFVISLDPIQGYLNGGSEEADEVIERIASAKLLREISSAVLEKARKCVWERGVLVKEPCLCHGVTGNAIALDEEDERFRLMNWAQGRMREQFLATGSYVEGDDPWGLFCGEAGRAWGWMVVMGLGKGMIGYSDV